FNMEPYKGKTFNDFREAMEARYGKGAPITKRIGDDKDKRDKVVAVAWRAGGTALRAVDLMQFYAHFCIAFSDEAVDQQMDAVRAERTPKAGLPKVIVSDGKGGDKVNDPNADVIERITAGKAPAPGMPEEKPAAQQQEPAPSR